ncbi:histone H1.11R-like [Heterodontus francisci]|uniref:histone H1.11R-like n=1 Tax=Heterodontus francisci TaxID=7792 RepID=UPI00355BEB05
MSDILPARKRKGSKAPQLARRRGTTVCERILEAVAASKLRRGLSLAALKKMLAFSGFDVAGNKWRLKQALRSLVNKGTLVQSTGSGASGSFKLRKGQKDEADRVEKKPRREHITASSRKRAGKAAGKRPAVAKKPKRRIAPRRMKKSGAARSRKGARGSQKPRSPKGRKAARIPGKG